MMTSINIQIVLKFEEKSNFSLNIKNVAIKIYLFAECEH